jgi:hypothetical protein
MIHSITTSNLCLSPIKCTTLNKEDAHTPNMCVSPSSNIVNCPLIILDIKAHHKVTVMHSHGTWNTYYKINLHDVESHLSKMHLPIIFHSTLFWNISKPSSTRPTQTFPTKMKKTTVKKYSFLIFKSSNLKICPWMHLYKNTLLICQITKYDNYICNMFFPPSFS